MPNAVRSRPIAFALTLATLVCLWLAAGPNPARAADPPAGDHLVVSQIPSVATAQAVTLKRLDGTGASDGTGWTLPTATSGANKPFTLQGDSNAVGGVTRSADGRYVTMAGYTAAVGGSAAGSDARVVARVNAVGDANTSTTLGTAFTTQNIRGAVTNDGSSFYVAGNGNTSAPLGALLYAPVGSTSPTVIASRTVPSSSSNSALNNSRTAVIADGNVWFSSEKGTAGLYRTTGLPTSGQTVSNPLAFGSDGAGIISIALLKHDALASTSDVMYVVRETQGIYKFSWNGTSWINQGSVDSGSSTAYAAVTAKVDDAGDFRLYATKGTGAGNSVVTMTDSAAYNAAPSMSSQTTLATAAGGQVFRGVAFAPSDPALAVPSAPTGVSGTAGNAKVTLSWTAPSDGGSAITGYTITPYKAGVAQTPIATGAAATSYDVTGLTNGTAYTFTVTATNANGNGSASAPSAAVTPQAPGAAVPTISLSAPRLEGTAGDATNPTVDVTVAQTGTAAADLTVTATASSRPSVAAVSGVTVTGSGATRTVSVTPAGVGYANITLTVTGAESKTATATLGYAASAATTSPSTSRFLTGASDASAAIDVGDGYVLVGDDEDNVLRLYKANASGAPVKTWNVTSAVGGPEEMDIEASARVGNVVYWTGSMGNSKSGNLKPDRSTLFTTTLTGTGASTEVAVKGYYRGLRADLIAWDQAHANKYKFAAGAAAGNIPKQINGFNVEGLELAPGSTSTAYVGFRAPLAPATAGGKAIVVPVTNLDQLATSGQNTSVHATFGTPIEMDLGGLSIRDIRRNAHDQYLILAGSWAAGGSYALYTWDGVPAHAPVKTDTHLPDSEATGEDPGAWEAIPSTPDPLVDGAPLRILMDNGSADFYGDGQEAKALSPEWQKSRSDVFDLALPAGSTVEDPTAVTGSSATLHGTTGPGVTGFAFLYRKSGEIEWTTAGPATDVTGPGAISAAVTGLDPLSVYYYKVRQYPKVDGVYAYSATGSFRTGAATPTAGDVVIGTPADVTSTGATLSATVDTHGSATTGTVEWGTTTSYGKSAALYAAGPASARVLSRSLPTQFAAGTTYHYRVTIVNAGGTVASADHTFTTEGLPAPDVTFGAVDPIGSGTATVNMVADTDGATVTATGIQYGTTTSYGKSLALLPGAKQPDGTRIYTRPLISLKASTTYHYRVTLTTAFGTFDSGDRTFTTSAGGV